MKINRLVLASTSIYRRQLLEQVGIRVDSGQPLCDESAIGGKNPEEIARNRSEAKGLSLKSLANQAPFLALAADQVLDFQNQAYGKAYSRQEAAERLALFQGKTHLLHSAYCLVYYDGLSQARILKSRVVSAKMHMRRLMDDEIEAYLDIGEWQGCAGSYQYENRGMQLFDRLEGDMSTVVGLPLPHLLADLRALGINPLLQAAGPWECVTAPSFS